MKDKREILLVEDSNIQARTLIELLEKRGYLVIHARDGVEGLYLLMESIPDVIISDIWMPKMNGYEFCSTVKNDSKYKNLPIILLTSLSSTQDIVKGLNAGADYYITKPYNENILLTLLDTIFKDKMPHTDNENKCSLHININSTYENINASSRQILNFLISTCENFIAQNKALVQTKHQLKRLNEKLENRVQEKIRSIEATLNGVVRALATVVELRDPYTAGHQLRVSHFASTIARQMGLNNEQIEGIRTMGLLHDIGKIIVPAEVLSKPSSLTDYEFHFIKAHSKAGYDILKGIEFPFPVAEVILQHHERIDGSGYPAGLKRDDIMLEAKIIAVADVIESMASHRPYRPSLGIEFAIDEVVKNKGILYEPEVVEAAVYLLKEENFNLKTIQ